jgi:hypothetical protein
MSWAWGGPRVYPQWPAVGYTGPASSGVGHAAVQAGPIQSTGHQQWGAFQHQPAYGVGGGGGIFSQQMWAVAAAHGEPYPPTDRCEIDRGGEAMTFNCRWQGCLFRSATADLLAEHSSSHYTTHTPISQCTFSSAFPSPMTNRRAYKAVARTSLPTSGLIVATMPIATAAAAVGASAPKQLASRLLVRAMGRATVDRTNEEAARTTEAVDNATLRHLQRKYDFWFAGRFAAAVRLC